MQAASKDTLQSIHVFLQLREAIKMYAKLLHGTKMEALTTECLPRLFPKWKAPHYLGHPLGGGGEFQMTGVLIRFSNSSKNDKWNTNLFFNSKQCKNEKRNSNQFFKVMRKRQKRYEVQISFSKLGENDTLLVAHDSFTPVITQLST